MLISAALNQVHLLSQGNTDYPTSGDDDFALYLGYINNAIGIWQHQEGIAWNELVTTYTATIVSGDPTYVLTSNYSLPAGQVYVSTGIHYQFSKPEMNPLTTHIDSAFNNFTVTGPLGTKILTLYPTPDIDLNGATLTHPYYKEATTYTTGAETTPLEMSDPYYAIHYAVGMVMLEDNPNVAGTHINLANQKLSAMRIANDVTPPGTREVLNDLTFSGFGV